MLYLFDLDGTLISGYMETPEKDYTDWHVLPGRWARMHRLQMAGHTCAIVTNQGGVAFGSVDEAACQSKIDQALLQLGIGSPRSDGSPPRPLAYVSLHDTRGKPPYNDPTLAARRKPSGTMIREAIADHAAAAAKGVLFVGDRAEDEAAAIDADVPFVWSDDFFATQEAT